MPSLSPPITPEQLHVWFHAVQMDVVKAFRLLSSGNITSAALVSHEMKTLYTLVALLVVLTVKPIRSAAWKTIDTLIALVLLVAISAVILGIPFVITYLSFKAVMFVGASLLVHVKTLT
mmetsp:Transcript_11004/g.30710  ORF Transcript_11004/g.30710 Transcript_11004/m.30710 type:complete len:119 (-) Transcript_11004:1052-1408(-)